MSDPASYATGGCQCGAIRFRVTKPLGRSVLCHCGMCQRAVGNAFASLVHCQGVEFTREPARYASSEIADRGYCRDCGTPLFYEGRSGQGMNLMLGSFDDPTVAPPTFHCGVESQMPWLKFVDGLDVEPTRPGGLTGNTPMTFQSYQNTQTAPAAEDYR